MVLADVAGMAPTPDTMAVAPSPVSGDVHATRGVTARDSSRAARMLKRAVQSGLNSVGVSVLDLEVVPLPVVRFVARRPSVVGAVALRVERDDPNSVVIQFMDGDGADGDPTPVLPRPLNQPHCAASPACLPCRVRPGLSFVLAPSKSDLGSYV